MKNRFPLLLMLLPVLAAGQATPELQQILDRLNRLETENVRLNNEVRALREALVAAHVAETPNPPVEERLAVQETRTNDLSQTSVQASQRLPISLSGMVLFNAFANGGATSGTQNPLVAARQAGGSGNGAGLRQSIVGLRYQGPTVLKGGRVSASVDFDLWGGTASSLDHLIRLRTATVQIDWRNQSLMVGQDKPLVAQRDPTSLAQVAFSPLTAAGNLWLWQPQTRFEQRIRLGSTSGIRAQGSVYQTSEPNGGAAVEYGTVASSRPALQGRFEFWSDLSERARLEIAPGFHVSNSRVGPASIPSRLFTADWLFQPVRSVQLTGTFFKGKNAAGLGGLRQGFTNSSPGTYLPVRTAGGWSQLAWRPTARLNFNIYAGQESNQPSDLLTGRITRNLSYAGNAIYQLGSNIRIGFEASQARTKYKDVGKRLVNHYDLALAYLF